jgi:predicted nucleic acid-binding Zn ribbon protein
MFNDTVECPYCEYENDMSEGTVDLPDDNKFDHECEECGNEFEVFVEFNPSYIPSAIIYIDCEKCGRETREPMKRGKVFPFPKSLGENVVCRPCFFEGRRLDDVRGFSS